MCNKIIFLIILIVTLSGCSVVTSNLYFAPDKNSVETEENNHNYHSGEIRLIDTGPDGRAVIINDELQISVEEVHECDGLFSLGPGYFPVVPIFAVCRHFKEDSNLTIKILIEHKESQLLWNIGSLQLEVNRKEWLYPKYYYVKDEDGMLRKSTDLYQTINGGEIDVIFDISVRNVKSFRLHLDKFIENKEIVFPVLEFKLRQGYNWTIGP